MKANKVLKILQINRVTLYRYIKSGKLKANKKNSGQYEYDDEDVYRLAGFDKNARKKVAYINGTVFEGIDFSVYDKIYHDKKENLSLYEKTGLKKLISDVIDMKIKEIDLYQNSLSADDILFLNWLFNKFGCEINLIKINNFYE